QVRGTLGFTERGLLIAARALFLFFAATRVDLQFRRHFPLYALIGVVGTAIPFTLFGYAGLSLGGSTMAILNTTAPVFVLLIGAMLGWERLSAGRIVGVAMGAIGVWL